MKLQAHVPLISGRRRGLPLLYSRLFNRYGPQHWWPATGIAGGEARQGRPARASAWEMMVGAILTQNTAWSNVEKAIAALKRSRTLSVRAIARMPRRRLEKLIRPSGYFRQKAKRLQLFAKELREDPVFFHSLSGNNLLPPLWGKAGMGGRREKFQPPTSVLPHEGGGRLVALRDRLLSLHGIGPETADSILLYAARQPVFVVDAYTRRIGQRIGLFKTNDYDQIQHIFESALRPSPSPSPLTEGRGTRGARGEGSRHLVKLYNEFHALIVRLAKEICVNHNPKCEICPVRDICKFGMQPSPALRAPSPQGERAGHGLPSPFREKVAAGRMRGRSPQ